MFKYPLTQKEYDEIYDRAEKLNTAIEKVIYSNENRMVKIQGIPFTTAELESLQICYIPAIKKLDFGTFSIPYGSERKILEKFNLDYWNR